MRVLITGAGGMLASSLTKVLAPDHELILSGHQEKIEGSWPYVAWDITEEGLAEKLAKFGPIDAVIHCAAFTKVDLCEVEREIAFSVNVAGTKQITELAQGQGARLFYISTDYVFNGEKELPYHEEDPTDPVNYYGFTKREGENAALAYSRAISLRVSWLFGGGEKFHNFVNTMVSLADNSGEPVRVVADQRGRPTYTETVGQVLQELLAHPQSNQQSSQIFHVANQGTCSWYEFAVNIFRARGAKREIVPVTSNEFKRPALRPKNSVLATEKIEKRLNRALAPWHECLSEYLEKVYK